MKKIIFITIIMFFGLKTFSQETESIITQITQNNLTLKALEKSISADSLKNKTDLFLPNPEFGFSYLVGSPSEIGNRKDFSILQQFDFPTAYIYKKQISDLENDRLQFSYLQQYSEIVMQAKLICIDLIYYNMLIKEYTKRFDFAQKIASSYKLKFEIGETNILEYNKAELNKLNSAKDLEKLHIEKQVLLNELIGLNGNISITFTDTVFTHTEIPKDFEIWYAEAQKKNPMISWLKTEIEICSKQENLSSALSLPKFKAGYMSEFTAGQNFQGISLGVSIPLWENKNKQKYAQLKTQAAKDQENANNLMYFNTLKNFHSKALSLQKSIDEYEINLLKFNNSELLYKALEQGEIDVINYISELTFYYQSYINFLDMEKELQKTIVQMNRY